MGKVLPFFIKSKNNLLMKLDLLRAFREQFKNHIRSTTEYNQAFKWECQDIFKHHWDIEELDLVRCMIKLFLIHNQAGYGVAIIDLQSQ